MRGVSGTIHGALSGLSQEADQVVLRITMRDIPSAVDVGDHLSLYMNRMIRVRVEAGDVATIPDEPTPPLVFSRSQLQQIAESLDAQEAVTYCGTDGCMHPGHQHDLANRCLLCACRTFSSRRGAEDMLTRLRLALASVR